jgi:hypothetical protein
MQGLEEEEGKPRKRRQEEGEAEDLSGAYVWEQDTCWPGPSIYGVNTVFLAGKSPNIRSYTMCIRRALASPRYLCMPQR